MFSCLVNLFCNKGATVTEVYTENDVYCPIGIDSVKCF